MQIGVPKEIKNREGRVGLTPNCVREYLKIPSVNVCVEKMAGLLSGFSDEDYILAGARIVDTASEAYSSDMVVKIKEPINSEFKYLNKQVLFTYIHAWSPANNELREAITNSGVIAAPYEEIKSGKKRPCLEPMSAIAGKLAIQKGSQYLESSNGGNGILLSSLAGIKKANVLILGGGTVGKNAAESAVGLGANVTILDINLERLIKLDKRFNNKIQALYSNEENIINQLKEADLVIGATLGNNFKVIKKDHLKYMKHNSLIVDVSIDEGGCVETSRVTTHDDPIFDVDGIRHYCVANMPALVARTATHALTMATLPYGLIIAEHITKFGRNIQLSSDGINTFKIFK